MVRSKEDINSYHRDWRSRNKGRTRIANFKYKYGITNEDYTKMLHQQNNRCAICLVTFDDSIKETAPHIDHCHITKKVRGLLCNRCNAGLGQFGDDLVTLTRALNYLTPKLLKEE